MTLIGLTGYAGSGKDTVASILVEQHGFKRYAFADKLRELCLAVDPEIFIGSSATHGDITWRLGDLVGTYGWDHVKRTYPEVREMLQRVGVWHRENVSPDFWVNLLHDQMSAEGHPEHVVITDVRFENESDYVRRNCGHVVRINRLGVGPVNGHESEKLDFEASFSIRNDAKVIGPLRDSVSDLVWLLNLEGAA